jgi:hypothetical protein
VTRRIEAVLAALLAAGCASEKVKLGEPSPFTLLGAPERLSELCGEGKNDNNDNPTLTGDLLEVYFTSTRAGDLGDVDVWFARRGSDSEPFEPPQPLTAVNSNVFDTSPAISPDGLTLWLGSARGRALARSTSIGPPAPTETPGHGRHSNPKSSSTRRRRTFPARSANTTR